jgi:putative ABC transport system ATP-binding protein
MLIRLKDVTRVYKVGVEDIHALKGIDLEIAENEYVAIMGPSGSGKSTMMNLLGCLDRATSGTYELSGEDTTHLETGELARIRNQQIGFVFQSFELLSRQSALKNTELPLIYSNDIPYFERRKRAMAALERVGLGKRYKHHPNQLSGGEKQRVAIARALVCNPSILLADEPTGNLDTRTGDDIMAVFGQLHREGQTIVMVTHEESIALHAQRVIRMRDGTIHTDERRDEGVTS